MTGFKVRSQALGSFHSFRKYLLSTYYVINMPLVTGDVSVKE